MYMPARLNTRILSPTGDVTSALYDNNPDNGGDVGGGGGGGGGTPGTTTSTKGIVTRPPNETMSPLVPVPINGGGTPPPPPAGPLMGTGSSYVDANGVGRYNASANTDPALRGVGSDEVVQNRLADLTSGNSRYIQDARLRGREAAAKGGMLMSSVAAGMSERAAIESALPIAQQDAATYNAAARDNQAATNQDLLTDQQNRSGFIGQDIGINANAAEASQQRVFSADQTQRDRDFNAAQAEMARTWQGSQAELQRAQERSTAYYNMMFGRESTLSQTIASIYSNTALTAAQQQAAVNNAMSVYGSLWSSMNRTLAQGIPDIFSNPYPVPTTP